MSPRPSGKRNFVFLLAEKVLQLGAIAIVNVVLLRSLGPESYGYLGAATSILAIALPLTAFGQITITGFLSTLTYSTAGLVRLASLLSIVASVLAATALFFVSFAPLMSVGPTANLILILCLAVLARPLSSVDAYFQSTRQNGFASVARTSALAIATILRLWIAFTSQSLELLAWVIVLENLLAGIFLLAAYLFRRRSDQNRNPRGLRLPYRKIVGQSWPLLVSGLAVILYMRLSQPLLLLLADSTQVAYYSAATNLTDAFSFLPTILLTVLLPAMVALNAKSAESFAARMQRIFDTTAGAAIVIAAAGVIAGPEVVWLLYGKEYVQAGQVVQILCLGIPFIFLGVMRNIWIVVVGFQRETLIGSLIAVLANVGLNIVLIPPFGAYGAAWAAVAAHAINGYLAFVLFRRTREAFLQSTRSLMPWRSLPALGRALRDREI